MDDVAYVRVVHASPDAPPVDAYLDGVQTIFGAPFTAVTPYGDVPAGDHNFVVTAAGDPSAVVIDANVTLEPGVYYTVAATGLLEDIMPVIFTSEGLNTDSSMVKLNVYHLSPGAPNVDVLAVDLDNAKVVDNLAYPNKAVAMVNPMAVNVNVVPAGATEPVVGNLSGIDITGGNSYSVFAMGLVGGEGEQAFTLVAVQDEVAMGSMGAMAGSETGGAMMNDTMMVEDGTFEIELSGSQEVPPVMTDATGSATIVLMGDNLSVTGDFEGLSSPAVEIAGTPAHIHMAPMGENGDVVFPLNATVAEDGLSGVFSIDTTLTPEQVEAVMAGNFYINIHSEMHQSGELRGQIVPNMMGMMGEGEMTGMAFGDLDTDASGGIDESEFNAGMEMSGGAMSGAFSDFDTDASGDINEDEFNAMNASMMGGGQAVVGTDTGMSTVAFGDLDADASGTIDENEFNTNMGMFGDTFTGTFADFDTDASGDISEEEFNTMNSSMMDVNDDGATMTGTGLTVMDPNGSMMTMAFSDLDADASGSIDENEFSTSLFGAFDADVSGSIDENEFDTNRSVFGSTFAGVFSDFDADASGDLNDMEFRGAFDNAGLFGQYDADVSGDINEDEFGAMSNQ